MSVLLERETELTEEQFWWVMNEWCARGEGFLKAIWQTQILSADALSEEDRTWADYFRPHDTGLDIHGKDQIEMHGELQLMIL